MSGNVPIYGTSATAELQAIDIGITANLRLEEFIITLSSIMSQLKAERNKENAIARLENLRRALLFALGRENEYYVIQPESDVGPRQLKRDKLTGKITFEQNY